MTVRSAGRRVALPWGQGLLCGLFAACAAPTALLTAGLLAPAIVMAFVETAPGRPGARCMALGGLAAAAFPLATLWNNGHSLDLSLGLLSSPDTLVLAWAAQGSGWLLSELLPAGLAMLHAWRTSHRIKVLRAERERLEQEWGIAPYPAPLEASQG